MIRIVGLSATLPNYQDVGEFLGVRPSGVFHFGPEYRPVPLAMSFIGVSEKNMLKRTLLMTDITYERAAAALKNGHQAMVFVHSRKDTAKTAEALAEHAASEGAPRCPLPPTPPHLPSQQILGYVRQAAGLRAQPQCSRRVGALSPALLSISACGCVRPCCCGRGAGLGGTAGPPGARQRLRKVPMCCCRV